MKKSEISWRKSLTPAQYSMLCEKAAEAPFTGDLLYNEEEGVYVCAACSTDLFASQHKFEAAYGWPSFYDVANSEAVRHIEDNSQGMKRVEVLCKKCDGHLGHVFHDAPDQPTGVRFCINSVSLDFKVDKKGAKNDS